MQPRDPRADDAAPFKDVLAAEWEDIRARREVHGLTQGAPQADPPENLKGLALSGGGIRSATFCLGVLQRLAQHGFLKRFDYLSTVSGGGFIGAWWTAWLSRDGQPEIFPPLEGLETRRSRWYPRETAAPTPDGSQRTDASRSAGADPVHHLRLFANYLTPKKGALSADTWRAITVVSRNLLLTVLMLVPLLGAAILASQFYYTAGSKLVAPYVCDAAPSPAGASIELGRGLSAAQRAAGVPICASTEAGPAQHKKALLERAAWVALPLLILASALLVALVAWMLFSTGMGATSILASLAVAGILVLGWRSFEHSSGAFVDALRYYQLLPLLLIGGIPIALIALVGLVRGVALGERPELLTNQMTRAQSAILVLFTVIAAILLFGGYAHELVRHVFVEAAPEGNLGRKVAQAGGWLAVVWAGAGALFTGFKAAPSGGADNRPPAPGMFSKLVFAVTPPLVLLVMLVFVATLTHTILRSLYVFPSGTLQPLVIAFFIAIFICFLFGTYELWTDADTDPAQSRRVTLLALGAGAIAATAAYLVVQPLRFPREYTSAFIGLVVGIVAAPWATRAILSFATRPAAPEELAAKRRRFKALSFGILSVSGGVVGFLLGKLSFDTPQGNGSPIAVALALGGLAFAATFVPLATLGANRMNHRMLALHTFAVLLLGPMLMQQFLNPAVLEVAVPTAIVALIGILVGSIIGLGWMLDPNYLALHTFYRARLVRAYLGASNLKRHQSTAEISESVEGDDVALKAVADGARGGPYHLVNATLNLTGGRDLATAQRSSAYFTMSRRFCGSLRTGYRPTTEYMDGTLSLGTAVAVSGAAASPNMGSRTPSAALAMLMALMNVRLGFWAPTPNQPRWRSARPRLWPFYLLREFLSQTNDLSLYCYLTDGGHFDNTGLYSLVQRGCRQILFVDCGADPDPCFSDLGDAIRRCRIDFGADIQLEVGNFRPPEAGAAAKRKHFVTGTIVYSEQHARDLGWRDTSEPARTGTMIWLKPSMLPSDPAEVQQYKLAHTVFPQQSTADQWFDEAQFESYRRLGETCAQEMVGDGVTGVVLA